MLELHVGNVLTKIIGDIPSSVKIAIREQCAYSIKGAEFSAFGSKTYCPFCKKMTQILSWEEKKSCPNDGLTYRRCLTHGLVVPISLWDGRKFLFDSRSENFPTGIISRVVSALKEYKVPYKIVDERLVPYTRRLTWHGPELRYYQKEAVETLIKKSRGIIHACTGCGKCFRRDQGVLMFDGTIKKIQDIVPGDLVMGMDSKPRTVVETHTGYAPMYTIKSKHCGPTYTVTGNHILSLKITNMSNTTDRYVSTNNGNKYRAGDIVDISVEDFVNQSTTFQHVAKTFGVGVDFSVEDVDLPIDPYILGVWLGDGHADGPRITTMDPEVVSAWSTQAVDGLVLKVRGKSKRKENKATTYSISKTAGNFGRLNPFWEKFKKLNLVKNKHIPQMYLTASRKQRAELLAGILDTDGFCDRNTMEIVQKRKNLAEQISFLARSLGLHVTQKEKFSKCQTGNGGIYYRLHIGGDFSQIPFKVPRRIPKSKIKYNNTRLFGFDIIPAGMDQYFGFSVAEADKHFLLDDFTVVHNSNMIAAMTAEVGVNTLVLAHTTAVFHQLYETLQRCLRIPIGRVGDGYKDIKKITVVIPQAIVGSIKVPKRKLVSGRWKEVMTNVQVIKDEYKDLMLNTEALYLDETHRAAADTVQLVANSCVNAYFRVGVSATPYRADLLDILIESVTGKVAYKYTATRAIHDGYLSKPVIHLVKFKQAPYPKKKLVDGKLTNVKYADLYQERVTKNNQRNLLIANIAYKHYIKNESVLVIVRHLEHGQLLYEKLKYLGKDVRWVNGENDTKELKKVLEDLNNGTCKLCIASGIFNEGIDVAGLNVCINTTACDSPVTAMQILGRTLRRTTSKNKVDFYDIYDYGVRWLGEHAENRLEMYQTEPAFEILSENAEKYLTE